MPWGQWEGKHGMLHIIGPSKSSSKTRVQSNQSCIKNDPKQPDVKPQGGEEEQAKPDVHTSKEIQQAGPEQMKPVWENNSKYQWKTRRGWGRTLQNLKQILEVDTFWLIGKNII